MGRKKKADHFGSRNQRFIAFCFFIYLFIFFKSTEKSMTGCSAVGCHNRRKPGCGKTFHCFPFRNEQWVKQWLINIRREKWNPGKASVICSDHFETNDFDRTGQTVRIKDGAMPTIFSSPSRLRKVSAPRKRITFISRSETTAPIMSQDLIDTRPSELILPQAAPLVSKSILPGVDQNILPRIAPLVHSGVEQMSFMAPTNGSINVSEVQTSVMPNNKVEYSKGQERMKNYQNSTNKAQVFHVFPLPANCSIQDKNVEEFTLQPEEPPIMETAIQIVDVRSQFPDETQADPMPLQFEDIRSQFPCPENWSLTICKNELWFGKLRNCSFILRYIINKDMETRIEVLQQELKSHKVLEQFPYKVQNLSQLNEILITLDQYNVCQGNVERDLIEAFYTKEKRTGKLNFLSQALYSLKCELLARNFRCVKCRLFRWELYRYINRRQQLDSRIKSGDQIINPMPKAGLSNLKARTILSSCEKENNFEIEEDCNERSIENVTEVLITLRDDDHQYTK